MFNEALARNLTIEEKIRWQDRLPDSVNLVQELCDDFEEQIRILNAEIERLENESGKDLFTIRRLSALLAAHSIKY